MQKDTKIYLEIERAKIKREKARLVLEKSIALYFIFMFIGVVGFLFGYIDSFLLNTLIVLGIIILVVGIKNPAQAKLSYANHSICNAHTCGELCKTPSCHSMGKTQTSPRDHYHSLSSRSAHLRSC